jgi:hypothetical protein
MTNNQFRLGIALSIVDAGVNGWFIPARWEGALFIPSLVVIWASIFAIGRLVHYWRVDRPTQVKLRAGAKRIAKLERDLIEDARLIAQLTSGRSTG